MTTSQNEGSSSTEHDEPNEYGFAGGATAPEPERGTGEGLGESIAVPAGDLTEAISEAIDEATTRDDKS